MTLWVAIGYGMICFGTGAALMNWTRKKDIDNG